MAQTLPARSVERGAELPEAAGGFPTPQGWEKGWDVTFCCFLHGCSSWGRGVSVGRGRLREVICLPSVPQQNWGSHFVHSQLKSCALGLTLVWLLWRIHALASGGQILQGLREQQSV